MYTKLGEFFHKGSRDKPAIVCIHGLGMDKNIWTDPCQSRILGGKFPLAVILGKKPQRKSISSCTSEEQKFHEWLFSGEIPEYLGTVFDDFMKKGFPVITWTQSNSVSAPIQDVVDELGEIIHIAKSLTDAGVVLIGHSRGGLVARKYLLKKDPSVKGLVTIATPHHGSSVAHLARYIAPFASVLEPFFPGREKGTLSFAVKRVNEFLNSSALKEILPDSAFYTTLDDVPSGSMFSISLGGTNPRLFTFYRWQQIYTGEDECRNGCLEPVELFSVPDMIERMVPGRYFPPELQQGRGDGLVTAQSARLSWGDRHYDFNLNHAEILFDTRARNIIVKHVCKFAGAAGA
jgi:pimeloyl-ACP methyl ester carboxylesterase